MDFKSVFSHNDSTFDYGFLRENSKYAFNGIEYGLRFYKKYEIPDKPKMTFFLDCLRREQFKMNAMFRMGDKANNSELSFKTFDKYRAMTLNLLRD